MSEFQNYLEEMLKEIGRRVAENSDSFGFEVRL